MTRRRNKAVGAAGARRERAGGAAPPEPPAPPAGPGLPEAPEAAAAAASSAEQGRASQVPGARPHPALPPDPSLHPHPSPLRSRAPQPHRSGPSPPHSSACTGIACAPPSRLPFPPPPGIALLNAVPAAHCSSTFPARANVLPAPTLRLAVTSRSTLNPGSVDQEPA